MPRFSNLVHFHHPLTQKKITIGNFEATNGNQKKNYTVYIK